jgi:hypothetical protein
MGREKKEISQESTVESKEETIEEKPKKKGKLFGDPLAIVE